MSDFRVYREGQWPDKKKRFYPETFSKRQKARNFCRNRQGKFGLVIVHPNGTEEAYKSDSTHPD